MKIVNQGVTINEVPGVERIEITPRPDREPQILIEFEDSEQSFSIEALEGLIAGLAEGLKQARLMAGQPEVAPDVAGPWGRLEDIPEVIRKVYDKVDDVWWRDGQSDETGWTYGREPARDCAPFRLNP